MKLSLQVHALRLPPFGWRDLFNWPVSFWLYLACALTSFVGTLYAFQHWQDTPWIAWMNLGSVVLNTGCGLVALLTYKDNADRLPSIRCEA